MKQPEATVSKTKVAPYHQQIPDYQEGMILPEWITVLYCRLSNGDRDKLKEDDSDSIVNQKKILGRYATDNRFINPVFFIDDDITGTTFKRDGFQAAIALVEAGRVKNFVVKDMSRFGRDYIRVGLYMETFQEMDVRLVAVYDNVDSARGIDEMTPFRNIMNEFYARDTSKKIRAVFRAKAIAGEHVSGHVPYGYMKDPDNPKRWIVGEEAAAVVRQIFGWYMDGLGVTYIAHRLRDMRIETPSHHDLRLGKKPRIKPPEDPYDWNVFAVIAILSRREYLGHTVNCKTHTKSYKNKKVVFNDPSEYLITENTHEAIIDQATFDRVQELREQGKRRRDKSGRVSLFSGTAYCADCKAKMSFSSGASLKPEQDFYACSGFRTKKPACHHSHYIRRVVLESAVLEEIQHVTAFAANHEQAFVELLRQDGADKSKKDLAAAKRKLAQAQARIAELDVIVQRMYEDNVTGKLTDERFVKLSRGYEQEQADLTAETKAFAEKIAAQEQQTLDLSRFLTKIRKYTRVTELTPTMLNELVERIEIHAPDNANEAKGKRRQDIDIYFNHIGLVGKLEFAKAKSSQAEARALAISGENGGAESPKGIYLLYENA
jgi:DNA invertase Pin-like site-specific DNA recombinase